MKTKMIAAALTATVLVGAVALPAVAQSRDGRGGQEHSERQRGDAGRFMEMLERFDADGDGSLTQAEIDGTRADRLAEFDANNDGQLTIAEYEALWLDAMRERMVDQFQRHDDDGDGLVTTEEFNEDFASLVERRDRNGDGLLNEEDRGQRRQAAVEETE